MNIRKFASIGISVVFLVLLVTGVLLYSTPYDYFTSSLHTWASIFFITFLSLHFYNNWGMYKTHVIRKKGWIFFIIIATGVLPVSYLILSERAPMSTVIEFGERLRASGTVKDGEFQIVNLATNNGESNIEIFIKTGEQYTSDPQPLFMGLTYTSVPQMVIWLESLDGEFIDTLYVTNKLSNSSFQSSSLDQTEVIRRPEALPYWGHRRNVTSSDGLYLPEVNSKEFDGITAATPRGDQYLILQKQEEGAFNLFLEVNRSYDFNEYYSKTRFPNDEIYSGSGSSGQPSLIYKTSIDTGIGGEHLLRLVGHGHHSGKDGDLRKDLSNMTTAKEIFSFVVARVEGKKL